MVKLYSLMNVIRSVKGVEETVPPNTVFDSNATEAKSLDAIRAARPATKKEIDDAEKLQAVADGLAIGEPIPVETAPSTVTAPPSGAKHDPSTKAG